MFKRILFATLVLLSLTPLASEASLVNADAFEVNDGLAALDTETGSIWLDLSLTAGKTADEVSQMLDTELYGWRFPTHEEIKLFAGNAFNVIKTSGTPVYTGSRFATPDERTAFYSSIGATEGDYSYGLYFDDNNATRLLGLGPNGLFFNYQRGAGSIYDGFYLIKEGDTALADVPGGLPLVVLAFMGLLIRRKHQLKQKGHSLQIQN